MRSSGTFRHRNSVTTNFIYTDLYMKSADGTDGLMMASSRTPYLVLVVSALLEPLELVECQQIS